MNKNEKRALRSCMVELNEPVLAPVADPSESDGSITPGIVNGIIHVIVGVAVMARMS